MHAIRNPSYAIYNHHNSGPTFGNAVGNGHDFSLVVIGQSPACRNVCETGSSM